MVARLVTWERTKSSQEVLSWNRLDVLKHIRGLKWTLSLRSNARKMATLTSCPIKDGGMSGNTVLPVGQSIVPFSKTRLVGSTYVPDDYGLWSPSDTGLVVDTTADVLQKEPKQSLAFLLFEPCNTSGDFRRL